MDADGGNLHEVASDPDLCLSDANFTPDGARLVYSRFDILSIASLLAIGVVSIAVAYWKVRGYM